MLETHKKSEEIISILSQIFMHLKNLYGTSDYVEQNCHVLVATLYNLNLACQLIK